MKNIKKLLKYIIFIVLLYIFDIIVNKYEKYKLTEINHVYKNNFEDFLNYKIKINKINLKKLNFEIIDIYDKTENLNNKLFFKVIKINKKELDKNNGNYFIEFNLESSKESNETLSNCLINISKKEKNYYLIKKEIFIDLIIDNNNYTFNDLLSQIIYQKLPKSLNLLENKFKYRTIINCNQNFRNNIEYDKIYLDKNLNNNNEINVNIYLNNLMINKYKEILLIKKINSKIQNIPIVNLFFKIIFKILI